MRAHQRELFIVRPELYWRSFRGSMAVVDRVPGSRTLSALPTSPPKSPPGRHPTPLSKNDRLTITMTRYDRIGTRYDRIGSTYSAVRRPDPSYRRLRRSPSTSSKRTYR